MPACAVVNTQHLHSNVQPSLCNRNFLHEVYKPRNIIMALFGMVLNAAHKAWLERNCKPHNPTQDQRETAQHIEGIREMRELYHYLDKVQH